MASASRLTRSRNACRLDDVHARSEAADDEGGLVFGVEVRDERHPIDAIAWIGIGDDGRILIGARSQRADVRLDSQRRRVSSALARESLARRRPVLGEIEIRRTLDRLVEHTRVLDPRHAVGAKACLGLRPRDTTSWPWPPGPAARPRALRDSCPALRYRIESLRSCVTASCTTGSIARFSVVPRQPIGSTYSRCRIDAARCRCASGIAAISLANARSAAAASGRSPMTRGCAISSARSSASSRPGTCVRQPSASSQPPASPGSATTGHARRAERFEIAMNRPGGHLELRWPARVR